MTSRPTLIQFLCLDCSYRTLYGLPVPHSTSLRLTPPTLKKATYTQTQTHKHCPLPTQPKPSVFLKNYMRFSLRGCPKRHCCFHSLPRHSASKHLNSNEDFEMMAAVFSSTFGLDLSLDWILCGSESKRKSYQEQTKTNSPNWA